GQSAAMQRFRDLRYLRSALHADPYSHERIIRSRGKDSVRTIRSRGDQGTRLRERYAWVPMVEDRDVRGLTVRTILKHVNRMSDRLKQKIDASPAEAQWDVVFVGAGVHTASAASTIAEESEGDPVRMLTIDAGNEIAANFSRLGNTIARNSANRAERLGERVSAGSGNKNPSHGPVGDPDMSGSGWPGGGMVADIATLKLYASGSGCLMKSRVSKVEVRGRNGQGTEWPTRYRVTIEGAQGEQARYVYTNQVVLGTGIGKERIPDFGGDATSQQLVAAERQKIDYTHPENV